MVDLYSSAVLNRVVQDLKAQALDPFLLNTFFGETSISTTEEIYFDVLTGKPRLAPFVSPLVEGQIVQSQGYVTNSFRPAYIKDKRVFEDGKPVRRLPGQAIAGPIDPIDLRRQNLATESLDQIAMVNRRLEWMAAKIMLTGSVTVTGEKYPTTVVNFGRDAALTVTNSGTALWTDAASDPVSDLENWAGLIRDKSGANAIDVIMAQNVFTVFRGHAKVKDLVDNSKGFSRRTDLDLGPNSMRAGASYMGTFGAFNIWVYSDSFVDETGTIGKYIPDNYLVMAATGQVEGVRHFGAIKDEAAGFQALDYFQKSWTMPDPAARFLMLQSAPLVVPYRINATLSAKAI
jgi:hypothetical protein